MQYKFYGGGVLPGIMEVGVKVEAVGSHQQKQLKILRIHILRRSIQKISVPHYLYLVRGIMFVVEVVVSFPVEKTVRIAVEWIWYPTLVEWTINCIVEGIK